ncbi:MAG: efflux RND transporter periplasmic adaptor subunit [Rhodospirillales bacterium]|nr:efflux RND transporter periplasmic adaptor subunit [Rhodospirillales bacterium]MCW8951192.1 efflux RND transporter periplasmic adaptor subunit [Rhodospirillales bacterium]MCW8971108.1 efflux RND transporter periplasmic adaptor subunit [Rhodospirillales bacterium]MCW9040451.1 efflux RND transporter periplasmic adaptor subunit [Rhodospirillales bacterium]
MPSYSRLSGSAFGAFVLSVALALPCAATAQDDTGTVVHVDAVVQEKIEQTIPLTGRLLASQSGVVAARSAGPVAELRSRVGDRVEKDQVIAVLVSDSLRWQHALRLAEVGQQEASLEASRTDLDRLTMDLSRLERLRRSAAFNQARFEDKQKEVAHSRASLAQARAELDRARANLKLAEIALADAEIKAPYAGVVSVRHTEAGAYLNVGAPVYTLINDEKLEIEADVPSVRVTGLSPGVVVPVKIDGQKHVSATVRAVVPEENPLTRTRAVRFTPDFDLEGRGLAANQSVTLELPLGETREAVTVHKDALIFRKGSSLVFAVQDGIAKIVPVKLGEPVGGRFEVLGGVEPGMQVVIRGNERLRPDQKVRIAASGQ